MIHYNAKVLIVMFCMSLLVSALSMQSACSAGNLPQAFKTPEDAVSTLVRACRDNDTKALIRIFGSASEKMLCSGDEAQEKEKRLKFFTLARQSSRLVREKDGRVILVAGRNEWPFPVPLAKEDDGWRFDVAAGREEIANRLVGADELQAIAACQAYVAAQRKYISKIRDGNRVKEYARKLMSTEGKKDGLYWPSDSADGDEASPLGPLVAESQDYLTGRRQGDPYYGYYFKILTRQGPQAPGGASDYVINGAMTAGFALIAWPVRYGSSGVMTFMVNQSGEIFEKDLGEQTSEIATRAREYNPDSTWKPVRLWLARRPVN